jgi:hypothetical protein
MQNGGSWPRCVAGAIAGVALLGGCATAPRAQPIDSGSPVAFVVAMRQPAPDVDTLHNSAVGDNAGSGAMSGAAAGALYGLLCGPAFIVCSPIAALMGAGVGAAAGATVGLAEALPRDKVAQLTERLLRLQQSIDPVLELRMNVLEKAGKHWQLTDDTSMTVVTLEVQGLSLTSDSNENISLVVQVLVSQRSGGSGGVSRPPLPKRYSVVSQGSSLAAWLDERSDLPEAQLRSACQQIATQVVSDLAFD